MTNDRLTARATTVADVLLTAAGCGCVLILTYYLYHYEWTGQRRFTSWTGILFYYGVPALAASLLFLASRLHPSARINVAFLLCSTLVSVYGLEVGLEVWTSLPSVNVAADRYELARAARAIGVAFDTRRPLQVVRDLRSEGMFAQPAVSVSNLLEHAPGGTSRSAISLGSAEVVPLAGMSSAVTVLCNEGGEYVVYESDEHGFNNPPGIWDAGPIDIVALGDSFVHGHCVPADRNLVATIRSQRPATLSLGMQGNGPLVMLATLREYAAILQPKVVLWFYFENDLVDLQREDQNALLRRYRTESGFRQGLIRRQAEIDLALADYVEQLLGRNALSIKLGEVAEVASELGRSRVAILRILKLGVLRTILGLTQGETMEVSGSEPAAPSRRVRANRESYDRFAEILMTAKKEVDEWGGRLYFAYLPAAERYIDGASPNGDRDHVLRIASEAGLPIVDIYEVFLAHRDPLSLFPFRLSRHYTEEGHRLAAEAVLREILVALQSPEPPLASSVALPVGIPAVLR